MRLRRNLFVLVFASAGLLSAPFQVSAQSAVTLDFSSFIVTSSVVIGSPTFTVFGPDDPRFTGPAALASDAVSVTATLANGNDDTSNLLPIDVSEFNPQGCPACMDPP